MKNKYSIPLIFVGIVNLTLFLIKLYIGISTNSLCIYTDSINNLFDTLSAIIALFSTFIITKQATSKFPFGYGRIEYIIELIMSLVITVTGFYFAYTSIARISMPTPVWFYQNYAIIISITCIVKFIIGIIFKKLYKNTNSIIYKSIMLDSFLDTGITLVALISFIMSNSSGIVIDGFLGLLICIIITYTGIKLIIDSVSILIGKTNKNDIKNIKNKILSIDANIKIITILIDDYGINNKTITLCIKSNSTNKQKLQNNIKKSLKNEIYNNIYIEWED